MTVGYLGIRQRLLTPDGRSELIVQGESHNYSPEESVAAPSLLQGVESVGKERVDLGVFTKQLLPLVLIYLDGTSYIAGMKDSLIDPDNIPRRSLEQPRDIKNPTLSNYAICSAAKRRQLEAKADQLKRADEYCEEKFGAQELPRLDSLKHMERIERGLPAVTYAWAMSGTLLSLFGSLSILFGSTEYFVNGLLKHYESAGRSRILTGLSCFYKMKFNSVVSVFVHGYFWILVPLSFIVGGLTLPNFVGHPRDYTLAEGANRMITNHPYRKNMIVVGAAHVGGVSRILIEKYGYSQISNFSER